MYPTKPTWIGTALLLEIVKLTCHAIRPRSCCLSNRRLSETIARFNVRLVLKLGR